MSQKALNLSEMDSFQLRLLNNKEAEFFTKDGQAFFYVGGQKYNCGESNPNDMGIEGDIKASGPIVFWQREEYWVLSFLDRSKRLRPVVMRAGNILNELEAR